MWYRKYSFAQKFDPRSSQGYFELEGIRNPSLSDSDITVKNEIDDDSDPDRIYGILWAYYGDNILGRVEYILQRRLSVVYLGRVEVREIYRNMGIAELLFKRLKDMALSYGYRTIYYDAYHPSTLTIGSRIFGKPEKIHEIETGDIGTYDSALERLRLDLKRSQDKGTPISRGYEAIHRIK